MTSVRRLMGLPLTWRLLPARAQQRALPVVAFINGGSADTVDASYVAAFRKGLNETRTYLKIV